MSQRIPIYIPTFISDATYAPSRVLPHIYFFNGTIQCEQYYIQDENGAPRAQTTFPYFDNYNVVTGNFPSRKSMSLLFNNESAAYGTMPNQNLYTEYWETYVNLLYNPYTRLLTCEAIIPLADYFKMELNDIVNFRGNYYHLRAINDYSLKTGECQLQLLGPIIPNAISDAGELPPTPDSLALIHLNEINSGSGTGSVLIDANLIVSGTAYYFSGNFTQSISGGAVANVVMEGKDGGSTNWGGYTTASATLSIFDNDTLITSSTKFIYSGSGDAIITIPTTFTSENIITISGSTNTAGAYSPVTATLSWTFTETNAVGSMDLYVNGSIIESRTSTSSGTYTVRKGDAIYVVISTSGCSAPDGKANSYTYDIIADASCADTSSVLTTSTYTVQTSDLGKTLSLRTYALCDGGCI
jgi:hypothetical protein